MNEIVFVPKKRELSADDAAAMNPKDVQHAILKLSPDDIGFLRDPKDLEIIDLRNMSMLLDEAAEWEYTRGKQEAFKTLTRALEDTKGYDFVSLRDYNDEELEMKEKALNGSSFGARASVVDAVFEARARRLTPFAARRQGLGGSSNRSL